MKVLMKRRDFLKKCATVGAAGFVLSKRAIGARRRDKRPNILFIMTDQQHAGMLSCTGNKDLHTTALDGLAASGIRFERAYPTNPVCVPARFSLQTGQMPSAVGMTKNDTRIVVPSSMLTESLGPLLQNAGYECAYGGKVHLPNNLTSYVMSNGYTKLTNDSRDNLADVCADFIRQPHTKPFFLFASFINPHDICYMAINDYQRSIGQKPVDNLDSRTCENLLERIRSQPDPEAYIRKHCPQLPKNFEIPFNEPECITTHYVQERSFREYVRKNWSEEMWRLHRWLYCRLTETVDAQIARVLDALRQSGMQENTLIIFTSDHGDHDSAHRLEHKSILYEESVRVPFIMSFKGVIPEGKVDNTHFVSNGLDLLPTICDYAGVAIPESLPGKSLRPLTKAVPVANWRQHIVVESQNARCVRTKSFKYCVYEAGQNREMLLNMETDPGEMKNLAGSDAYQGELNRHRRLLEDWVNSHNDTIAKPYIVPST